MSTPFQDWKTRFLAERELESPDGRPLYAYRLTDSELRDLESLLQDNLQRYRHAHRGLFGGARLLGFVSEEVPAFASLFVLYAAGWWQQRYDGSGFVWAPILTDIGATDEDWSATQRSDCVSRGIREWCLFLRDTAGLRYLGTIAVQGGLPVRLLAAARGALGRLLRSVLREASKAPATIGEIRGWVTSLESYLPQTYRQPEIAVLLAEVVDTVLVLKQKAGLTQSAGALQQLDGRVPGWRERFPLPVGDRDAQALIEQLIKDAASSTVQRPSRLFVVERSIEHTTDKVWQLRSGIQLPERIDATRLAETFRAQGGTLPRFLDLSVKAGSSNKSVPIRRLAGEECYRVERRPIGFSGIDAMSEHRLQLSAADGQSWSAIAPAGECLDDELPWLFDAREEPPSLLRQGGGSVATNVALVVCTSDWRPTPESGEGATSSGVVVDVGRHVFSVGQEVTFVRGDSSCRIRTGRVAEQNVRYELHGDRLWECFVKPEMAFRGRPRLYQLDETGQARPVHGEPLWSAAGMARGTSSWTLGPMEMRYPATGEIKHRARMVILPAEASIVLEAGDVTSGRIGLRHWGASLVRFLANDVEFKTETCNESIAISVSCGLHAQLPEWLEAEVFWPHNLQSARVRLPFPARGVRIFSAEGRELPSSSRLSIDRLIGVRVLCMPGVPVADMKLELRLHGSPVSYKHTLKAPADSARIEIRINEFRYELQQLLARDDRPDALVEIIVHISNTAHSVLKIGRYDGHLEVRAGQIVANTEAFGTRPSDAGAVTVLALRLQTPADEALRLEPRYSEGVPVGVWDLGRLAHEPGAWLVYPAAEVGSALRPTLHDVAGFDYRDGSLAQAIGIADSLIRRSSIDICIQMLAEDHLHPDWNDVERFVSHIGHLPLVNMDLWRRFARSGKAMAAFALRYCSIPWQFLDRFASEMPFAWETVTFSDWGAAMRNVRQHVNRLFGDAGDIVFRSHIESRISSLTSLRPALSFLLGLCRDHVLQVESRDTLALRGLNSGFCTDRLFKGDNSPFQRLMRHHSDESVGDSRWPSGLVRMVNAERRRAEIEPFLCMNDYGFRNGVVNVPLLLAVQVVNDKSSGWFDDPGSVHELRTHYQFDPDWFVDAFNWTIAKCFVMGMLDRETHV